MGELYGGLDVSDKLTHLCVRDGAGALVWRGRCASEAAVIETGPWSGWLVPRLREHGLPADCICARHAKRVLAAQGHQSDVRDAEGLAQLARTGRYRAVHVKQPAAQQTRAMLGVREWPAGVS